MGVVLLAPVTLAHVRPLVLVKARRGGQLRLVHVRRERVLRFGARNPRRSPAAADVQQLPGNESEFLSRARGGCSGCGCAQRFEENASAQRIEGIEIDRKIVDARRS